MSVHGPSTVLGRISAISWFRLPIFFSRGGSIGQSDKGVIVIFSGFVTLSGFVTFSGIVTFSGFCYQGSNCDLFGIYFSIFLN